MTFAQKDNNMTTTSTHNLIKVSHGDDTRRSRIAHDETFNTFLDTTAALFGLDAASSTITWLDDEGDKINLTSDADLAEALTSCGGGTLRLHIESAAPASTSHKAKSSRGSKAAAAPEKKKIM